MLYKNILFLYSKLFFYHICRLITRCSQPCNSHSTGNNLTPLYPNNASTKILHFCTKSVFLVDFYLIAKETKRIDEITFHLIKIVWHKYWAHYHKVSSVDWFSTFLEFSFCCRCWFLWQVGRGTTSSGAGTCQRSWSGLWPPPSAASWHWRCFRRRLLKWWRPRPWLPEDSTRVLNGLFMSF